jgi:hypothetical protein
LKLVKRNIDSIATPEKVLLVRDDELSGFSLRVCANGRKVFFAQYRVGGGRAGRQRKVTIGVYGKITAEDRGGSVCLNRFRRWDKWISASVMLRPGLAAAG